MFEKTSKSYEITHDSATVHTAQQLSWRETSKVLQNLEILMETGFFKRKCRQNPIFQALDQVKRDIKTHQAHVQEFEVKHNIIQQMPVGADPAEVFDINSEKEPILSDYADADG